MISHFWKKIRAKSIAFWFIYIVILLYSVMNDLVAKLFDEVAPKYVDRKGGYTRIIKIGERKGDAAMEVVLELV